MLDVQRYVVHRVRQQIADPAATGHVLLQQRVLQQYVLQRTACIRTRVHLARLCACLNVAAASHAFGRVHRLAWATCTALRLVRLPVASLAERRSSAAGSDRRIAAAVEPGHGAHPHRPRASTHAPLCDGRGEDDRQQVVHVARACAVSKLGCRAAL